MKWAASLPTEERRLSVEKEGERERLRDLPTTAKSMPGETWPVLSATEELLILPQATPMSPESRGRVRCQIGRISKHSPVETEKPPLTEEHDLLFVLRLAWCH